MAHEQLWNGYFAENPEHGFRITADSFLLADFAPVSNRANLCDLGCGAGCLSMMLLADHPDLHLVGVEILPEAAALAETCFRENKVSHRAELLLSDWRELHGKLSPEYFDCVVSNPPYFPDTQPASTADAPSRFEQNGTLDDLCHAAAYLLKNGGHFSLVYRADRLTDLLWSLRNEKLEPKRIRFVRHNESAKRTLVLVDAVKGGGVGLQYDPDFLFTKADGSESDDARQIYHHEKE